MFRTFEFKRGINKTLTYRVTVILTYKFFQVAIFCISC